MRAGTGRVRRHGVLVRRPELLPVATTGAGWIVLLVIPGHGDAAHAHLTAQPWTDPGSAVVMTLATTLAMTAAMMGPLAVPGARTVAACSIWWGGRAAVTAFVAAFLGTWEVLALSLGAGVAVLTWALPAGAVAFLALLAAGADQLDPGRARLVDACARPARIRAVGRGALADAARFGGTSALRCGRTCALAMIAMLVMPAGRLSMLLSMAALTGLAVLDRTARNGRRRYLAAGYALVGVVALL